ncbi:TIGR00730 family Rossman fold protein [Glutamicibacter sp.]|uniref:TIGR00730 family Rossman fold protein n=1 Tax=Glutamicibacter sp. TaxID=1931995 RepID=UPI0028BE691D|nr:TIGR00730 family Rossman fold protein [Glutamicibacter sp.]
MSEQITVSAVVIRNPEGQVLTVRKRGTDSLMFPGGKPEPGETSLQTAVREFSEELGIKLEANSLKFLGVFTAPAANEDGFSVKATVFEHPYVEVTEPCAEIEHLQWVDPTASTPGLAPLTKDEVFPALLRQQPKAQRLTVFTGSAIGASPVFAEAAEEFGQAIAESGREVVYGGGKVGLMGVVADAVLRGGGQVHGVMPQVLIDGELAHPGLTSLEVVPDMHARKNLMTQLGDGFIALPGGAGTLEELFEAWTWQQLGIHRKPVALYDVDGFWQPLLVMLKQMTKSGFLSSQFLDSLIVASNPEELFSELESWVPPVAKWGKDNREKAMQGS